jgi:hypothetical protein
MPATVSTTKGKTTIELFRSGGEGAGIKTVLDTYETAAEAVNSMGERLSGSPTRGIFILSGLKAYVAYWTLHVIHGAVHC